MAESTTSICNQSLARLGGRRIANYDDATDTKLEAVYCRLFFEQEAKALIKDHYWPFAKKRVQLSETTAPAWQWDHAFLLPNDYLRTIMVYDGSDNPQGRTHYSYEIEGNLLLTNETAVYLKYLRWVPDVGSWDPLFTEVFVSTLAKKLVIPLSQDTKIKADIDRDLFPLLRQVRAMDRQENESIGRADLKPWADARFTDTA
jgi:hypothetical protein